MLASLGGQDQVTLALSVRWEYHLPRVFYSDHPSAASTLTSVQEFGAQVDDRVVWARHPHGGEEGLALVPVAVWESHGPFLLQRGLLGGGEQARVHVAFGPAVGRDKRVVHLRAPPLAAAGPGHAHHRPAAARAQHAVLLVAFAAGAAGRRASGVAVAVAHDPADGETGQDGSCGEGGDGRHHQQVHGHQAIGLVDETLLQQQPCKDTIGGKALNSTPTESDKTKH